jgi:hypothetical protein
MANRSTLPCLVMLKLTVDFTMNAPGLFFALLAWTGHCLRMYSYSPSISSEPRSFLESRKSCRAASWRSRATSGRFSYTPAISTIWMILGMGFLGAPFLSRSVPYIYMIISKIPCSNRHTNMSLHHQVRLKKRLRPRGLATLEYTA